MAQTPSYRLPAIAGPLLAWYRQHRRRLPFREDPTPYHVWVSEIMLQQTQVATVLPYYARFIARLPNVAALAACDEQELFKLWEGLGYYSRARNLQKASRQLVAQHGGQLPVGYGALLALPGIGPYTAGAIASIAFGQACPAVDGNVLRVATRLLACEEDISLPATRTALTAVVEAAMPVPSGSTAPGQNPPGDFNQALMELGALVCTPKSPSCAECPLAALCAGHAKNIAHILPVKAAAPKKLAQPMCVLVVHNAQGQVLLQQRPTTGLLAGLWQPPVLPGKYTRAQALVCLQQLLPTARPLGPLPRASHMFSHRVWQLYGWRFSVPDSILPDDSAAFLQHSPGGTPVFATAAQLRHQYAIPGAFSAYLQYLSPKIDTNSRL